MMHTRPIRIGIDIGGTFTDFVVLDPVSGSLESFKLLSSPQNPALTVLEGLGKVISQQETGTALSLSIIHGSTVATNALLERKGARTALLATVGFKDVLQIGRQNRPFLYDFQADPPPVLVPAELRLEVPERVDSTGQPLIALDPASFEPMVDQLKELGVESVAICFLFSFLNPDHERLCAQRLRQAGFFVTASYELLPEYREYERTSTTVVNAYVTPVLGMYLGQLQDSLGPGSGLFSSPQSTAHLRVMQSNGGILSVEEARRSGVRCVLSGPAGGVVGAQAVARQSLSDSQDRSQLDTSPPLTLITFDMGGTSTDVSLIDGSPQTTSEMVIGGCPIRLPVLDIHTIGAGGGSIASVDAGGALRVGPESAGADPGPACYGRADDNQLSPTVTDANLLLGRLSPEHFLGGQMRLYPERSLAAIASLADKMSVPPQQAALGIIAVVNAHMERALRLISVERGFDPRQFTLLSFGGAGGLHATELASRLGIRRVLIPRHASTLSAFGMLTADVVKDYSLTVMVPGDTSYTHLQELYQPLVALARQEMGTEGFAQDEIELNYQLDARYLGQSYELTLPLSEACVEDFLAAHNKTYGYHRLDTPVEIVNLRLQAIGKVEKPVIATLPTRSGAGLAVPEFHRELWFQDGYKRIPFYTDASFVPRESVPGPAIVLCPDTTIYVGYGWLLVFDQGGNYLLVNGYTHFTPSFKPDSV